MLSVNLWMAASAGAASFFSPCCLPLYPTYLSYLTGLSASELKGGSLPGRSRFRILLHSACFLAGLCVVFYALSWSAGELAGLFAEHRVGLRRFAAVLLLVMGLFLLGVIRPGFLLKDRRGWLPWKSAGYAGSFLIGIGFAAGWSPCIGSTLSLIVAWSAVEPESWLLLTTAYSAGFALPFLLLTGFIGASRKLSPFTPVIQKLAGGLLIAAAVLLLTDRLARIGDWLNRVN